MKKDKEWAKGVIRKELEAWQNTEGGIDEDGIKYVLNIIDQLDEPEVLSLEWIDENKKYGGVHDIGYYIPLEKLQNLLVPKQEITQEQVMHWIDKNEFYDHATAETVLANAVDKGELGYYGTKYFLVEKPVLPKHVVDWIDENREYYENNPLNIGYDLYDNAIHPAVDNWIIMNEEKFMRAWLDGYRIAEKSKYYVDLDTAAYVAKWNGDGQVGIYTDSISGKDEFEFHLTEEEIKNYDERFWPFAKPVEVAE